ncbi:MAG: Mbeg1-like protein, partial [Bacteroidota bacterium]
MCRKTLYKRAYISLAVWLGTTLSALAEPPIIYSPTNLLELHYSPSPYECVVLSEHVYKQDLQAGDPVLWIDPETQQPHPLRGWTVLKVFSDEEEEDLLSTAFQQLGLPYGYRGALYVHAQKKQLVLAHRGTQLKNFSSIKTDARSIAQNIIGGQERILPILLEEALATAQQKQYALTVTGHSLGGWLAQVTAFIAKEQYPEAHVKAITFDSPGARPMLEQINSRINPTPLDMLDINNYLSSPNLINACNPHVGTVYRVVFEQFTRKHRSYVLQSHDLANIIRAFDPQTGDAHRCVWVKDWPVVSKKALHLGKQLLSGNKLNAILALCELFRKWSNQELLGEYSGFFKFAKKLNRYHPKPFARQGKDSFDLTYKYHYNTTPFDPTHLHIRHFPTPA